jgi:hypothetical protein
MVKSVQSVRWILPKWLAVDSPLKVTLARYVRKRSLSMCRMSSHSPVTPGPHRLACRLCSACATACTASRTKCRYFCCRYLRPPCCSHVSGVSNVVATVVLCDVMSVHVVISSGGLVTSPCNCGNASCCQQQNTWFAYTYILFGIYGGI